MLAPRNDEHLRVAPDEAIASALRMLKLGPDDVLVDLGCGDGRVLIAVRRLAITQHHTHLGPPLRSVFC